MLWAKNIIQRYSFDKDFVYLEISPGKLTKSANFSLKKSKNQKLAWIKSTVLEGYHLFDYRDWLQNIRKAVDLVKSNIERNGYLTIDTQDIRNFEPQR